MADTVTKSIVDARAEKQSSSVGGDEAEVSPTTRVQRLLNGHDLPGSASLVDARQRRIALLTRAIHSQVLPKLALAHRDEQARAAQPPPVPLIDDAELTRFTALVLVNDLQASIARMEELVANGAGLADICVSVLTPTAGRLGEMWDDDECSFVDVTTGLGALHAIMYRLREICGPDLPVRDPSRRILLASLAGNQHTFGVQMVADVFRHSGWDVTVETAADPANLPVIVRENRFSVAGLSVARDRQTRSLGLTIRAIRDASLNASIGVLVGGPAFAEQGNLARLVGADAVAQDAKQAVLRAEGLRLLMTSLELDSPG
jgi:methanogenic corrinoid protein MtbC1